MTQSRFEFPGFAITANQDTATHQVEAGTIEDGGVPFSVTMVRNNRCTNLSFLISRVARVDGKILWDFKNEGWTGIGVLAKANDHTVIALMGPGKSGALERIIPFCELNGRRPDLRTLITLKQAAAQYLDCDYTLSATETVVAEADKRKAHAASEAATQAAIDAKNAAREELVRTVLARGKVLAYTADGSKREGYPVLESEWPRLSNGVKVVMVASINDSGVLGEFLEAFVIVKERSKNPTKGFAMPVTAQQPAKKAVARIIPLRTRVVEMKDGAYEVQMFASMDTIREARTNGLNGGTFVAINTDEPRFDVFAVHHDRIDTVGRFAALD